MADPHDVSGTKMARSYMGRRGIDLTLADVRVMHGVCYIRGTLSAVKGGAVADLKTEVEQAARVLRQKQEIRDVILDCIYRT